MLLLNRPARPVDFKILIKMNEKKLISKLMMRIGRLVARIKTYFFGIL